MTLGPPVLSSSNFSQRHTGRLSVMVPRNSPRLFCCEYLRRLLSLPLLGHATVNLLPQQVSRRPQRRELVRRGEGLVGAAGDHHGGRRRGRVHRVAARVPDIRVPREKVSTAFRTNKTFTTTRCPPSPTDFSYSATSSPSSFHYYYYSDHSSGTRCTSLLAFILVGAC